MSDPRPLAARIEAALTPAVMKKWRQAAHDGYMAGWDTREHQSWVAAVLQTLLPVVEEPEKTRRENAAFTAALQADEPAEGPTPAPGQCAMCGEYRTVAAPPDDTPARVATFRKILARSGEDRIRASILLQTFNDLFVVPSA